MYERFTDRARKVMQLANQAAQTYNHEYVKTEHILIGLIREGSGVAANVLKNLNITPQSVKAAVEKVVQAGPGAATMGKLPHTPGVKKAMEYAIQEARTLDHNYVGTEHLLLGLLRQEDGVAHRVLTELGLNTEMVREEILDLLGRAPSRDDVDRASTQNKELLEKARFITMATINSFKSWLPIDKELLKPSDKDKELLEKVRFITMAATDPNFALNAIKELLNGANNIDLEVSPSDEPKTSPPCID